MTNEQKLRRFAQAIFRLSDWPEGGDIDGWELQDTAEKCGLLKATRPLKPCSEGEYAACACVETSTPSDFTEGRVVCYRKTAALTGKAKR